MEWLVGAVAAIPGFFAGLLPSFGEEMRYRMPLPSSIVKPEVTVLLGGDVMLDRSVRVAMQEHGEDHVFSCLGDTLKKADLAVVNLEGPITSRASKSVGSKVGDLNNTKFTFASTTGLLLKRQGIDVVSLANNHAQDFGPEGVRETKRFLESAGVEYFGDPAGEREYRVQKGTVALSFIGYNDFQDFVDGEWQPSSTTMEKVRRARAEGYLPIVFAHWGEEYTSAREGMKDLARALVDAGAEAVIGAHPHVVQEHEVYEGKHIYYSLGNFIFDQYFSEEVRNGLLVELTISGDGVSSAREIPVVLERDRRTCLK